jgi:hypothetical protein
MCYLFNRTESHTLPPGKTPYEMLHGVQPNLAHLHIFRACCFARIPSELQQKLGPQSWEVIFLGYPPGVKAWQCHDVITGVFFNSCDVIFDELSNHPSPDSDNKDDDTVKPALPTQPIQQQAPADPPHTATIRHSGCIPVPTEKGQAFKDRCESINLARLKRLFPLILICKGS